MPLWARNFLLIALAVAATLLIGFLTYKVVRDNNRAVAEKALLGRIDALSGTSSLQNPDEKFDALRVFVNGNSVHKIDADFYKIWKSNYAIEQAFYAYVSKADGAQPPHLECSTRTGLLYNLLKLEGYRVRSIIIQSATENLLSHIFVEVLNPQTGRWQVEDPDYNIYWRNNKTGERASFLDVVKDFDSFEPCGPGVSCGWDKMGRENTNPNRIREKAGFVTVLDPDGGQRYTVYPSTTDPATVFKHKGHTGTFCEVVRKNCDNGFFPAAEIPASLSQ